MRKAVDLRGLGLQRDDEAQQARCAIGVLNMGFIAADQPQLGRIVDRWGFEITRMAVTRVI